MSYYDYTHSYEKNQVITKKTSFTKKHLYIFSKILTLKTEKDPLRCIFVRIFHNTAEKVTRYYNFCTTVKPP